MTDFPHCKQPCAECPWRKDVPTGKFPPRRYRALAHTAYDMADAVFACHMSKDERLVACAGFLLRSSAHNLSVRFAIINGLDPRTVSDGGHPLFENYRALAQANGVRPGDPSLQRVRDGAWK